MNHPIWNSTESLKFHSQCTFSAAQKTILEELREKGMTSAMQKELVNNAVARTGADRAKIHVNIMVLFSTSLTGPCIPFKILKC